VLVMIFIFLSKSRLYIWGGKIFVLSSFSF